MNIHEFIKKKPHLTWYIQDIDQLSEESILEHTLNYGDLDDVRKIIKIIGKRRAASIFARQAKAKRSNYRPEIKNYFTLYFKAHA